ncbi:MAG: BON domain-containing protein [bacterium]|jgi:osmotically-inducible protein OsmY|nr:BON domain-containing protein [bacterium]MDD4152641.1 BON domain-containing protein [bacterium]MDD4558076.1 BON domain-containing protein [bacterium]
MAMSDEGLAARVLAALAADSRVGALSITVEAHGKIIILRGRVNNEEQRREAEFLARGVPGVREVINEIAVLY